MRTRYDVYFNGLGLQDIGPEVIVKDIRHKAPKLTAKTSTRPNGGLWLTRQARESVSVAVRFELHTASIARREELMQQVRGWAVGEGWLTTSDKPGKRLRCVCSALPAVDSALKWTGEGEITFTAYDVPYWQSESPAVVRITAETKQGGTTIAPVGDAPEAPLEAEITASGGTLGLVTLKTDTSMVTISSIALAKGNTLFITHDERGQLSIKIDGVPLLMKRTAGSSDDLTVPGNRASTITITADTACTAVFRCYGRWV